MDYQIWLLLEFKKKNILNYKKMFKVFIWPWLGLPHIFKNVFNQKNVCI